MTAEPRGRQCRICGHANPDVLEEHHLVPQRHGGSDVPENLVHLCGSCHNAIESLYDDQFYERLGVDTGEGSSERATPAPSGAGGMDIERFDSLSREIPKTSPHVVFQALRGVQWGTKPDWVEEVEERCELQDGPAYAIHCSYCHTVFSHLEHPEAARHLQIKHGIENPYEDRQQKKVNPNDGFSFQKTDRAQGTEGFGVEVHQGRLTPTTDIAAQDHDATDDELEEP